MYEVWVWWRGMKKDNSYDGWFWKLEFWGCFLFYISSDYSGKFFYESRVLSVLFQGINFNVDVAAGNFFEV